MSLTITSQRDWSVPLETPREGFMDSTRGNFARFYASDECYFEVPVALFSQHPWVTEKRFYSENPEFAVNYSRTDLLRVYFKFLYDGHLDLDVIANKEELEGANRLFLLPELETIGALFPNREFSDEIVDQAFDMITTQKWKMEDLIILKNALCQLCESRKYGLYECEGLMALLSDVLLFKICPNLVDSIAQKLPEYALRVLLFQLRARCCFTLVRKYRTPGQIDGLEDFKKEFERHLSFSAFDDDFILWLTHLPAKKLIPHIVAILDRLCDLSERLNIGQDIKKRSEYHLSEDDLQEQKSVLEIFYNEDDGDDDDDDIDFDHIRIIYQNMDEGYSPKKIVDTASKYPQNKKDESSPILNEFQDKFIQLVCDDGKMFFLDAALVVYPAPGVKNAKLKEMLNDEDPESSPGRNKSGYKMFLFNVESEVCGSLVEWLTTRKIRLPSHKQGRGVGPQKTDLLHLVNFWNLSRWFRLAKLQNEVFEEVADLLEYSSWELDDMEILAEVINHLHTCHDHLELTELQDLFKIVGINCSHPKWNRLLSMVNVDYVVQVIKQMRRMYETLPKRLQSEEPTWNSFERLCYGTNVTELGNLVKSLPVEERRIMGLVMKIHFRNVGIEGDVNRSLFLVPEPQP